MTSNSTAKVFTGAKDKSKRQYGPPMPSLSLCALILLKHLQQGDAMTRADLVKATNVEIIDPHLQKLQKAGYVERFTEQRDPAETERLMKLCQSRLRDSELLKDLKLDKIFKYRVTYKGQQIDTKDIPLQKPSLLQQLLK